MLKINEFRDFLKYLISEPNNQEYKNIFKDIIEVRNPWRAEWLDADFKVKNANKKSIMRIVNPNNYLFIRINLIAVQVLHIPGHVPMLSGLPAWVACDFALQLGRDLPVLRLEFVPVRCYLGSCFRGPGDLSGAARIPGELP